MQLQAPVSFCLISTRNNTTETAPDPRQAKTSEVRFIYFVLLALTIRVSGYIGFVTAHAVAG